MDLSTGRLDDDLVAGPMTQEGATDRRDVRDAPLARVGFRGAHDVQVGPEAFDLDLHARPEVHDPGVHRADDDGRPKGLLELADAPFEERLLVACRLVVGVLAQVAQLARVLDPKDDLGSPECRQLLQLGLEGGQP